MLVAVKGLFDALELVRVQDWAVER